MDPINLKNLPMLAGIFFSRENWCCWTPWKLKWLLFPLEICLKTARCPHYRIEMQIRAEAVRTEQMHLYPPLSSNKNYRP